MKGDPLIPPLRDLPLGRLGQRREHLVFEITREREFRGALGWLWPSRWGMTGRRRLVVVAAAALVVAVGAASAFGVRAFLLDKGFIGLPPKGATPSAPEGGELVLKWNARSRSVASGFNPRPGFFGALVRGWVYADGRVIWDRREARIPEGANEMNSGLLEQRLTPEGVELLRSEVVATGLFERNLTLVVPQFRPPRSSWGAAEVRRDGQLVLLQWGCPLALRCKSTRATAEQVSALRRLDALLSDPVSVLPSSAWSDRQIRAYVPSHYGVCVDTSPPTDIARLLSLLPARAEELLRGRSWTRSEDDVVEAREGYSIVIGRSVTYCSKLATEEAREVKDAVSGLARDPRFGAYLVAEAVNNSNPTTTWFERTTIWFEPYLPHGQGTAFDPSG